MASCSKRVYIDDDEDLLHDGTDVSTTDDLDSSSYHVYDNDDNDETVETTPEFVCSENGQKPHSRLAFRFTGKRNTSVRSVK